MLFPSVDPLVTLRTTRVVSVRWTAWLLSSPAAGLLPCRPSAFLVEGMVVGGIALKCRLRRFTLGRCLGTGGFTGLVPPLVTPLEPHPRMERLATQGPAPTDAPTPTGVAFAAPYPLRRLLR